MRSKIAVIGAALLLASCGDPARTVDRCDATTFGDWSNDCRSVYATVNESPSIDYEPVTHVLRFDGARFDIFVAITRTRYERFFTDRPPTQFVVDGNEYVADPNFFGDNARGAMQIGDDRFGLVWSGDPHLSADQGYTDRIRAALEASGSSPATVAYTESSYVRIPISGFADAVSAWD